MHEFEVIFKNLTSIVFGRCMFAGQQNCYGRTFTGMLLSFLTIADMRRQVYPTVFDVEEGVCNLTAADLETTAAEVGEHILYTNSTRIKVSIHKDVSFDAEIILWNATDKDNPYEIAYAHVGSSTNTCIFTNLSASQRYIVTYGGDEEMSITVSGGRDISFLNSLGNVLDELINLITVR